MYKIILQPTFNTPGSLQQTTDQQSLMDLFCNRFGTRAKAVEVANTIKGGGIHFKCLIEKVS